jgi:hypothetical protein
LHDSLRVGGSIALEPPAGSFVLPSPLPARLLMPRPEAVEAPVAAAMLRALTNAGTPLDLVFVHVARRPDAAIFAAELARLATIHPGLRVHHHFSEAHGRFDPAALAQLVPDLGARTALLCGPTSFMTTFRPHFTGRLFEESFGPPNVGCSAADATACEIRCARSERLFTADGTTPLLIAAEHAGLTPRYGCRMGISHTCSCVKRSGTVENVLTGEILHRSGRSGSASAAPAPTPSNSDRTLRLEHTMTSPKQRPMHSAPSSTPFATRCAPTSANATPRTSGASSVSPAQRIAGRGLLMFGFTPISWTLGVGALATAKILEHGDRPQRDAVSTTDERSHAHCRPEWDIVCDSILGATTTTTSTTPNIVGRDRDGYGLLRISRGVPRPNT